MKCSSLRYPGSLYLVIPAEHRTLGYRAKLILKPRRQSTGTGIFASAIAPLSNFALFLAGLLSARSGHTSTVELAGVRQRVHTE